MARVKSAVYVVLFSLIFLFAKDLTYSQNQPAKETDKGKKEEKAEEEVTGWRIKDFRPYIKAIEDLEKLNKEYSDNVLKLAIDEYATGLDILEDMENEVLKMKTANREKKYLNERFYWQEIDRKNAEMRLIARRKFEAKQKAITYLTRSINYMDQIENIEVKQEEKFANFQTRLYQVYVSTQYDLLNYKPCIPLLERYITLGDRQKNDQWAYKYLASCYGYMERVLEKYQKNAEDEILQYKIKKNRSLLTAVELKYGSESPHFKRMQEIVEMDEKKSELINDFR
jgi:hypothetical protein